MDAWDAWMPPLQYDVWARTTESTHTETVQMIWKQLAEKGYLYKGFHEGWYSNADEAFVSEIEVDVSEDGKSGMPPIHSLSHLLSIIKSQE